MPIQQAPAASTPAPTGTQGVSLRGAASSIASMLSDNFTIGDNGGDDGGDDAGRQQQTQRREPTQTQQRQTEHSDDEPIVREEEEIDDEGNIRFRDAEHNDDPDNVDHNNDENDDPEGQNTAKPGELKDDMKVTIPVGDGKTEEVTFGDLKKGYLRQADYTRKTQALATERETIGKDRTDLSAERASLTASIEAVGRFVKELIPQEPTAAQWEELRRADPAAYAASREEWRSFKERLQGVEVAFQKAQQDSNTELQRTIRDTATREKGKLDDALPEWKDSRVKKRDIADMFESAKKLGFTDADVQNTVDSRLMLLLNKAMKYDRMMAAKDKLKTQRGKSESEPGSKIRQMPAGSGQQIPSRKSGVSDARDAHRKSQSVRSGAALIEKLL